jgi:hypothetical protein
MAPWKCHFGGQTPQHIFIGVYEPSNSGVKITRIKVINKNLKKLFRNPTHKKVVILAFHDFHTYEH